MPPTVGDQAPDFEALLCDGETFRPMELTEALGPNGGIVVFFGFTGSAIAENWWKAYDRLGWDEFDGMPVLGVSRDGPYAQNRFLRTVESPFAFFADVEATGIDRYDVLTEREGMAGVRTARRAVFVVDANRTVLDRWLAPDWITPVPTDEIEATVEAHLS
ncbi:MAG: redoxin domain-containing protein [Halobacteriales archaeon]